MSTKTIKSSIDRQISCSSVCQKGQALAEYIIASVFLSIMVWYALVGGSVDPASGKGGLYETEAIETTGHYQDRFRPGDRPAPGLVQALHKRQDDFKEAIYQP